MGLEFKDFAFIVALAAVVNGMGIVRILTGVAEYVRRQAKVDVITHWVFILWVAFQFLLHLLLWWSMWGLQAAENFAFLHLLFVLLAPILLYLGSSLLIPDVDEEPLDLRKHYYAIRKSYFNVAALLWLWAILQVPVFTGALSPTMPIWVGMLAMAVILRVTAAPKVHAALSIASWALISIYTAGFALQLGQPPAA